MAGMSHHNDPFAPALHTAHQWLNTVAESIGTDDRRFAYRVLRAWLHAVRDRIGVIDSAHLAAQLPELLRGVYYENWVPAHVPAGHRTATFVAQFAHDADVGQDQVTALASAVTDALNTLCSPGQLDHVFTVLPVHLRDLLRGDAKYVPETAPPIEPAHSLDHKLRVLGDAVAALARGLEEVPAFNTAANRPSIAAQYAHRILLAEGLTTSPDTTPAG
ncbi:uncharacterized protein (DUF2267 family) [Nocardia sp. GAS34]